MANPDKISAAGEFEAFATLAALEAAFATGNRKGQVTRRIVCMTNGVLKLRPASQSAIIDWVFDAGVAEDIQVTAFTATGSTVAPTASLPVKVYF